MALFSIEHIRIKGLACAIPKNKVLTKDYPYHTAKESKQFILTTGIETRRVAQSGITASDLCKSSALELLEQDLVNKDDIKIIVFLSQTPDYKIPCTATILQNELGLATNCLAFDVNLGCSGYVYGLSIIASLIQQLKCAALLLVGDVSTSVVNIKDKSAAPLFSDAGSATLLQYDEQAPPLHFNLQSDGKGFDAIITKDGGSRNPINDSSYVEDEATGRSAGDMFLDGIKVFNFSRKEVAPNVDALLEHFQLNKKEIPYFVFHQANLFMNESIRKKLGLMETQVPYSIQDFGNTSSASIPITIVHKLRTKLLKEMVLAGFGVGLSWGSVFVDFEGVYVAPMQEI